MTHLDTKPTRAAFLTELQGLAGLASQQTGLTVQAGGDAEAPWSFNFRTRVITVNPADLALRSADFCRGLTLHECGHAALTRLPDIQPPDLLANTAVHQLMNTIEDCRLEGWLQRRLPGCAPWVRAYNDILFAPMMKVSREEMERDQATAFLAGILARWWHGRDPENLPDAARAALDEVWPHVLRAIAACPPAVCPQAAETRARYDAHPVRACYHGRDDEGEPTPLELETRMSQHEMWEIVLHHVLPVFQRLMEQTDSALGRLARLMEELRSRLRVVEVGEGDGGQASGHRVRLPAGLRPGAGRESGRLKARGAGDYERARTRYQPQIDFMAGELLRHLTAEVRLRHRRFNPSGQRLDLRQAMQYEADPRLHDTLWMRQTLPSKPDPAFVILADASGSMEGERAHATFDALVMLREMCLRLDIPLSLILFNMEATVIQAWDRPEAPGVREMLCALRNRPNGGTRMEPGLTAALSQLRSMPNRHRHFWLLSDGEVCDEEEVRAPMMMIRQKAASVTGLGLGPDTESLAKLVPGAITNLQAKQLPALAGRLFQRLSRAG
jgi:Mg-chelatase subunit ChlD